MKETGEHGETKKKRTTGERMNNKEEIKEAKKTVENVEQIFMEEIVWRKKKRKLQNE